MDRRHADGGSVGLCPTDSWRERASTPRDDRKEQVLERNRQGLPVQCPEETWHLDSRLTCWSAASLRRPGAPDASPPGYDDPFLTGAAGARASSASSMTPAAAADPGPTETPDTGAPPTSTNPPTTPTSASSNSATGAPTMDAPGVDGHAAGRKVRSERSLARDPALRRGGPRRAASAAQLDVFRVHAERDDVTVTRGLDCGFDVVSPSARSPARQICTRRGRRSWRTIPWRAARPRFKASASGCTVSFPAYVSIYGATVAYYRDPSHAMPGASDVASGSTPGWEDWDADGNPGVTYNLSGIASGQVFYASRQTNTWSGAITDHELAPSGSRSCRSTRTTSSATTGHRCSPRRRVSRRIHPCTSSSFRALERRSDGRRPPRRARPCARSRRRSRPRGDEKPFSEFVTVAPLRGGGSPVPAWCRSCRAARSRPPCSNCRAEWAAKEASRGVPSLAEARLRTSTRRC